MITGIFLKRYKRFMADFKLSSGEVVTAHCPNTGAMLGLLQPGALAWLSRAPDPKRKLPYTWEAVYVDNTIVGTNTQTPNRMVAEALAKKQLPEFAEYSKIQREVPYGEGSRIDFFLQGSDLPPCYIEVKNAHLKRGDTACFPDSVTERGSRHLRELERMVKQGCRAVLFYVIQRSDVTQFNVAEDLDPVYGQVAREVKKAGVEMMGYTCDFYHKTPGDLTESLEGIKNTCGNEGPLQISFAKKILMSI